MSDITAKINRIEELVEKLNQASEAYYNGKDEIMSNFEWDAMFDELTALEDRNRQQNLPQIFSRCVQEPVHPHFLCL